MGNFERQNFLNKPDKVKKAITEENREALRQMGKAGARVRNTNAKQDALYNEFLHTEDQNDRQKNADQRRDHLIEDL